MATQKTLTVGGFILTEDVELTLGEICRACGVSAEQIIELVEVGVVEPRGPAPEHWRFSAVQLPRIITALHLQRDLGLNLPGVALALELLEENRQLRARVAALERFCRF